MMSSTLLNVTHVYRKWLHGHIPLPVNATRWRQRRHFVHSLLILKSEQFLLLLTWILLLAAQLDQQHHLLSVSYGCLHPSQRSHSMCWTYCMSGSLRNSSLLCHFIWHQFSQTLSKTSFRLKYIFLVCAVY